MWQNVATCIVYTWLIYQSNTPVLLQLTCIPQYLHVLPVYVTNLSIKHMGSASVYLYTCMYYLYTWLIYQSNTPVLLQFTCIPQYLHVLPVYVTNLSIKHMGSASVYLYTCMYYLYTWLIYQSNTPVLLQFTCIPACISARVIDMSHRRRRRVVYTRHEVYTAVPDTSLFCCRSRTDTPRNTHSRSCTPSST